MKKLDLSLFEAYFKEGENFEITEEEYEKEVRNFRGYDTWRHVLLLLRWHTNLITV